MICDICGKESCIIHVTTINGFICSNCHNQVKNSPEEKIRRHNEKVEMYIKYGLIKSA